MKRKFLIVALTLVCVVCLALGISACSAGDGTDSTSGTDSTLVMEEGIVYFTDFSIKYTSSEDSPNGDINESTLTDEINGSVQNYYLVMNFDMQLASNTDGLEYITIKFVVLDADVVETIINYADTSNVSAITSDGQTTITATYSLPDKARKVKNVNLILELKPKTTGGTDIYYLFSSNTKDISGYTDEDITYNYTSGNISTSKTSLEYTLNDDGQSYSVTGIGTKSGTTYIKEIYNGLPVTAIGDSAFENSDLKNINIPDSVTSIGAYAFSGCTALGNITIPNSVTSIGEYAFNECTALTSVTIPDSVTSIGDSAFDGCTSLIYYDYENGYYLGNEKNNFVVLINVIYPNMNSFIIHSKTKVIYQSAFYSCTSLTSIIIPNSVTSIGNEVFVDCISLTSVTISDSVTSIGSGAFGRCTSLKSITIPDSVTSIGNYAFSGCTSLTNITISDNVTSIGSRAFDSCTSLTSITIPDSVITIGSYAFYKCTALTNVTLKNTDGWYVTKTEGAASGTIISSSDLSDTSTAATYLTSKYYNNYWYRK